MSLVVLPPNTRFSQVEEVVARCGLERFEFEPQVFPARPDPARVAWCTEDGASTVVFRYAVNPDRRVLRFSGPDADDLRRAAVATLGELKEDELLNAVREASDEALAFRSAFLLAELLGGGCVETLLSAAEHRPDHSAWGCLRAMEPYAQPAHAARLRALRADSDRPASVRALAGEIASSLAVA
jgi:hypothetical protein